MSEQLELSTNAAPRSPQLRPYHFKPGQSGNPSGRPKGRTFARLLELVGKTRLPDDEKGKLRHLAGRKLRTAAALGLMRRAAEGDPAAFKVLADRVDGPVAGEGSSAVTIEFVSLLSGQAPALEAETIAIEDVGKE